MAGSNGMHTRSNHSQRGDAYWTRRFSPRQPDTNAWTGPNTGVPFPMTDDFPLLPEGTVTGVLSNLPHYRM